MAGEAPAFAASALGLAMAAVAAWLLIRARRQFAQLTARRLELERQLGRA